MSKPKYIIEGNIDFYKSLCKSLDEDLGDESSICQITGLPLIDRYVKLECNHCFNYDALFREICKQKFDFKTYDVHTLSKHDQIKFRESNLDYFIKCPYCRSIQFTVLPYYEELRLEKKYGINSLDKTLPNPMAIYNKSKYNKYGSDDYTFTLYNTIFKKGQCCFKDNLYVCSYLFVGSIPNTELSYCKYHYRNGVKKYKLAEKQKIVDEKLKQKQQILNERNKLFAEKNAEREAKGLPPLKRLPVLKKKVVNVVENVVVNVVETIQQIGQYVPETDDDMIMITGCKSILKTGPNKGKMCGAKLVGDIGLCKRHIPKEKVLEKVLEVETEIILDNII